MKLHTHVHLRHAEWKKALRPYCKTVRQFSEAALAQSRLAALDGDWEMSVVLADDEFVRVLNRDYRGKDKPTNVLSFPAHGQLEKQAKKLAGQAGEIGDIILAYETIAREAAEQGKKLRDHAAHLIVHGTLHLLGYDHENEADAAEMEKKEIKILKKQGIENPYLSNDA